MSDEMVYSICAEYEIRIVPFNQAPQPGETRAKATIGRILDKHGEGHLRLVLSTLAETKGNQGLITETSLWATSDLIMACSDWVERDPTSWFEAWDKIPLGFILWHVQELAGKCHMRHALSGAMYLMLVHYSAGKRANRELSYSFMHRVQEAEGMPTKRLGIEKAVEAGRVLLDVKASLPRSEFVAWLQREGGISRTTAQRAMQKAMERDGAVPAKRSPNSLKRLAREMIRIGEDCLIMKAKLPHGDFVPWLKAHGPVTVQTANLYMQLARLYGGNEAVLENVQATGLLLLARRKTSRAVRMRVEDSVAAGRFVTTEQIEAMLANARTPVAGTRLPIAA